MATSPGFDNRVDTLTLDYLAPYVVDTVLRENVFALRLFQKAKEFKSSTMDFPIIYSSGVGGTSFLGFDELPTAASDTRVLMVYNPRFYAVNCALPGSDIMANNTVQKVLDLATIEMKQRAQVMANAVGVLFYGAGTGNNNKDFLGLTALDDDGTNVSTIGNLSRTTYPTLQGTFTQNQTTLTLAVIRTLFNAISDAGVEPTENIMDRTVWALYERLLQPQERIVKELDSAPNFKGFTGYTKLEWAGMPVIADRQSSNAGFTGYWWMLNTDYLDWYALPNATKEFGGQPVKVASRYIEGNSYDSGSESLGFSWTGWIKSYNQFAFNSFMVLGGNMITEDPRRHGKISGLTTV